MRKRLETLLWILAGASIFAVSMTDPWFLDNWLRVVIILMGLIATAAIAFICGVSHGIGIMKAKMHDEIWGMDDD